MNDLELIKPNEIPQESDYVWRYLDIHKFFSFIWKKSIRFTRMDQFEDPLEGIPYTILNNSTSQITNNFYLSNFIISPGNYLMEKESRIKEKLSKILDVQTSHFISCWFIAQRESAAMWNLYSNEDGVALKIPFGNLKLYLKPDVNDFEAYYCGKVNYQNFRNTNPYSENGLRKINKVALRKDLSFIHENELRFVVKKKMGKMITGVNSQVFDLKSLDFEVICHPKMPKWKQHNIEQILEKAELQPSVKASEIKLRL